MTYKERTELESLVMARIIAVMVIIIVLEWSAMIFMGVVG